MDDKRLLKQLELVIVGRAIRIKELEAQVNNLKIQLNEAKQQSMIKEEKN